MAFLNITGLSALTPTHQGLCSPLRPKGRLLYRKNIPGWEIYSLVISSGEKAVEPLCTPSVHHLVLSHIDKNVWRQVWLKSEHNGEEQNGRKNIFLLSADRGGQLGLSHDSRWHLSIFTSRSLTNSFSGPRRLASEQMPVWCLQQTSKLGCKKGDKSRSSTTKTMRHNKTLLITSALSKIS